jgi:hypothetical protein
MKITVKFKDTEITVTENELGIDGTTCIKWEDKNKRIRELVTLMCTEAKELYSANKITIRSSVDNVVGNGLNINHASK